jgi:3-deoxy-D-manno-octulosonic-acid transferase
MVGLVVSSPWWLLRMVMTRRYREGLRQRLGGVPAALREYVDGKRVVWVHAVSVGEVLAASRLIGELEAEMGSRWRVVVSTTTRTGQVLARERFGAARVFYMPLDFAGPVRKYLRALRPAMLVLMESELWPRMLHECAARKIYVAVVNARVSDRSFARAMRVRKLWSRVLCKVDLWLAQSEEDESRLVALGANAWSVRVSGNLKFDVRAPKVSRVAERIREIAAGRPIVVAGSTLGGEPLDEEMMLLQAWEGSLRQQGVLLVLAPRHPERFGEVEAVVSEFQYVKASSWAFTAKDEHTLGAKAHIFSDAMKPEAEASGYLTEVVLLDTIGDLAAVYGVADVAFVGGSLVPKGGHNPLEPAQFGVPVFMGPHFQNFLNIISAMQLAHGIVIVADNEGLGTALKELLYDRRTAEAMGERGRRVFEEQQGATARTVHALAGKIRGEQH